MKVILQEEVPGLGIIGDIVNVKPGFARNFLIMQGKASIASERNIREFDHQKKLAEYRKSQAIKESKEIANNLSQLKLTLYVKASEVVQEEGKDPEPRRIYGSISTREVIAALEEKGITQIDRKQVLIPEGIKTLGDYQVSIKLAQKVTATVSIHVAAEDEKVEESKKH